MINNTNKITDPKEIERLRAMKEYNILGIEFDFAYILESLLEICNVPFCSITAIYKDNYHVIASKGFDTEEVFPRKGSCTEYVHKRNKFCELANVQEEKDIDKCAKVLNGSEIIFYAGIPINDAEGFTLGILNILDFKSKVLTEKQRRFIKLASLRIAKVIIQRRQEQRLLQFDNMFSKSKDIMGIIRFDGEIININPAFYELLEYDESNVCQTNILDYIHPDYIDETKTLINILQRGKDKLSYTLPSITKNNAIKWIEWTSTPELNTGLIYFIGRDITAIEEQSILLKQSEVRFRNFFENSQSIMFIHDLQANIMSANNLAANVFGILPEEAIGKNLTDFLPLHRREYLTKYLKKINREGAAKGNSHVIGKDGEEQIWLYNSIVEKNSNGESYVLTNAVDVTNRYKMEEALKVATKKAEEANRA
ncbi:MAG: PAS domain S-box protein, partial [Bacteroidales bacterium]|nr:PAS domain S-box protein [Bacteroidales bacterium]